MRYSSASEATAVLRPNALVSVDDPRQQPGEVMAMPGGLVHAALGHAAVCGTTATLTLWPNVDFEGRHPAGVQCPACLEAIRD